jgi:NADP-dependent aldehyde dehydrogenase
MVLGVDGAALSSFLDATVAAAAKSPPATMLHPGIYTAFEQGRQRLAAIDGLEQLAASAQAPEPNRHEAAVTIFTGDARLVSERHELGRLVFNGFPTGLEICPSMHHGGPYPATSHSHFTSIGQMAIYRFTRPICFQGFPESALPAELQDANPRGLRRLVDGELA